MRFKTVPKPPGDAPSADAASDDGPEVQTDTLAPLATVRDALPRVPRPESDCCARLADRVAWVEDRATAREWLGFLRALGLATRTAGGQYVRADAALDLTSPSGRRTLANRFAERVLAADAVRDQLADEPVDPDTAFERVREEIPAWERRRSDDWERVWTERVAWLLEWWVLLGAARPADGGYVRASSERRRSG